MYIGILIRLILGYVRIEVEGYFIERFINLCNNKKILIWNLKREKNVKMYLNIGISDFKKISRIAKKTRCRVKIKKKRGVPFLLNRYKKRKIFGVLLIALIAVIFISSMYIWNVDIKVKNDLKIDGIEENLEKLGLRKGINKSKIDTEYIINQLLLEREDISWIGIDIEGTSAIVSIVKADEIPKVIDNKDYCNIVAKKDGMITKITARNGTAKVKPGDIVKKGDVLIEGIMEGKYTETRKVHSLGEIQAKVWYTNSEKVYFMQIVKNKTGKEEIKYELNFNNYTLRLYNKFSKFDLYETERENKQLKFGKNFYFPISITKIINKEEDEEQIQYNLEEAKDIAVKSVSESIESEIEKKENICDKIVKTQNSEDFVEVQMVYEVLEDIGENEKMY